jgi:hypothetical protein
MDLLCGHVVSPATRGHTVTEEVFSVRSVPNLYKDITIAIKSQRLSTNIKLTLHKAPIRSVMTYACPAWEFAAHAHMLKL